MVLLFVSALTPNVLRTVGGSRTLKLWDLTPAPIPVRPRRHVLNSPECARQESNLHARRHQPLMLACLPFHHERLAPLPRIELGTAWVETRSRGPFQGRGRYAGSRTRTAVRMKDRAVRTAQREMGRMRGIGPPNRHGHNVLPRHLGSSAMVHAVRIELTAFSV